MADTTEQARDFARSLISHPVAFGTIEHTEKAGEMLTALLAERDALKQTLHDELDANLRLRDLGGAKPDEPMTPFIERVIAERDALAAKLDGAALAQEPAAPAPAEPSAQAAVPTHPERYYRWTGREAEAIAAAIAAARLEERERCAMEVWYAMQEATADGADDKGLEGWMREAEQRIRTRA